MNPRPIALILAALTIAGCRSDGDPAEVADGPTWASGEAIDIPRGELWLDRRWEDAPLPEGAAAGALARQVSFTLEAARIGAGSVLVLDDPWYRVEVTLNGVAVGEATGGIGPVSLAVGPWLREGENRLQVVVSPPAEGGVPALVSNGLERRPPLGGAPRLSIRPGAQLSGLAVRAGDSGVRAVVRTSGAPPGAHVRVRAQLDGRALAELGGAEITGEVTELAEVAWEGARWSPTAAVDGALFHLVATLEDGEGRTLDRASARVGVRRIVTDDAGFSVDGKRLALLADRILAGRTPRSQLASLSGAGLNALEAHGEWPTHPWLDEADELGVPVVLLPRCAGEIWDDTPGDRAGRLATHVDEIRRQDRELAWAAAAHPSVMLWACEGAPELASSLCEGIRAADPAANPVAGIDLPSRSIAATSEGATVGPAAWIVEIGRHRGVASIRDIAEHFARESGGIYGGVALSRPPRDVDLEEWRTAWTQVAWDVGAVPLDAGDRRAPSRLKLSGLSPGQTAWVEVEGLTPVGGLAGAAGSAEIDLWHAGDATWIAGDRRGRVSLVPDRWANLARVSNVTRAGATPP